MSGSAIVVRARHSASMAVLRDVRLVLGVSIVAHMSSCFSGVMRRLDVGEICESDVLRELCEISDERTFEFTS